ncbi:transcription initiation factor IIF, alpha subunit (TFIIF-alpha) domain-containing protein [Ditylenchus destructor]|uniref:Transcription initiation factor IIF subunit alpha n=1 Tax=Ditylenchus destructor TaxID=166010 RepID=A0AAD4MQC4_9BILA|nr:transcription initiation factor IIF, alpha subunit (TFIIF-alpha) domain-containing protein [Ditylenchus destructor]
MPTAPLAAHGAAEALDEEIVRRLLQRKPHTTKELLSKVKQRCGNMSKQDIVTKLANILKKIEPYQFKQKMPFEYLSPHEKMTVEAMMTQPLKWASTDK